MRYVTFLASALAVALLAACGGKSASPTPSPSATASVAPARTTTPPPGDGTVSPLNPGSTDPAHVKANPDPAQKQALVTDVRMSGHPEEGGWDRLVFEFRDQLPDADIQYETKAVACGSGLDVAVAGSAILVVRLHNVAAHDEAGQLTIPGTRLPGPGNAVTEAVQICDFEGQVGWAVGLKTTTPFKVTTLSSPPRIVIDMKW